MFAILRGKNEPASKIDFLLYTGPISSLLITFKPILSRFVSDGRDGHVSLPFQIYSERQIKIMDQGAQETGSRTKRKRHHVVNSGQMYPGRCMSEFTGIHLEKLLLLSCMFVLLEALCITAVVNNACNSVYVCIM